MAESFVLEVCALPRCCSGVSVTAGSGGFGKIMDSKIISQNSGTA
jgi:hypothetical protein